MTKTVNVSLQPNWTYEALLLMLTWLLSEEEEGWIREPLMPEPVRPEVREQIGDRYQPLSDYLEKVREESWPLLQKLDPRWKEWAQIRREGAEVSEGPWLGQVMTMLVDLEPEEITPEKVGLAAADAVRFFAGMERESGAMETLPSMEELFGPISEMAIEEGERMQVIRFFVQLTENAEEMKELAIAIAKIFQKHFPLVKKLYTPAVQSLEEDPEPVLRWVERMSGAPSEKDGEDPYHIFIALVLHRAMNFFELEREGQSGRYIAVGILFIELEEIAREDMYSAKWIQKRLNALSDPTRFEIIRLLSTGPMYVQELVEALDLKAATLTHHLATLRWHLLVKVETRGRRHYYELSPESLYELAEGLKRMAGGTHAD